jgi:hypothetical protein
LTGSTNALNKIRPTDMSIQNKLTRKEKKLCCIPQREINPNIPLLHELNVDGFSSKLRDSRSGWTIALHDNWTL